jgi:hypothetical protein
LAVTTSSIPARAEEPEAKPAARQHRSRDVLERIDRPRPEPESPSWLETHISFHRKGGLQYSDQFEVGDRRIRLAIRGPFKGPIERQQLGLSFEVRF